MEKLKPFLASPQWEVLSNRSKDQIIQIVKDYPCSQQNIRQLITICRDFEMWQIDSIWEFFPVESVEENPKQALRQILQRIDEHWRETKSKPIDYGSFKPVKKSQSRKISHLGSERTVLGRCPVASEKTRCCNLQTLDAVIHCAYDCSYCSIQSFYSGGKVQFDPMLKSKLKALKLDPHKRYHIGTGQSSDSLLWGNTENLLDHLFDFAWSNPNVALELKTKSAEVDYLLSNPIPPNILTSWSLNPQEVIDAEEHHTASLSERLRAAEAVAKKGALVGFHFHPMIYTERWRESYGDLFGEVLKRFSPDEIFTLSFGTLTFIKPVLKRLRERDFNTRVLQIPLVENAGKFTYPMEIKRELFNFAGDTFSPWRDSVFTYLCMEDESLWQNALGHSYSSNDDLERAMLNSYFKKIDRRR